MTKTPSRRRLIQVALWMALASGIAQSDPGAGNCFPITGNRILGRDLALADPRYSALPASMTVGIAPAPGAKRVFSGPELARLARSNGFSISTPDDICFELPMHHLREEDLIPAMQKSLPPGAALRIVEIAQVEVPVGPVDFPLIGLEPASPSEPGIQRWRGNVKYAETREAPFWARVAITAVTTSVIADKDLPADKPIAAESLRLETRSGPLGHESSATRLEDVTGRMPKRAVKAGSPIPVSVLVDPPAVRRGDLVLVEVQSGPARLQFEAIAETAAHSGEMVELRNPSSGKTFRARLDAGPKALLIVNPGQKL